MSTTRARDRLAEKLAEREAKKEQLKRVALLNTIGARNLDQKVTEAKALEAKGQMREAAVVYLEISKDLADSPQKIEYRTKASKMFTQCLSDILASKEVDTAQAVDICYNLFIIKNLEKNLSVAVKFLELSYSLEPNPLVIMNLGATYLRLERYEEALVQFHKFLKATPSILASTQDEKVLFTHNRLLDIVKFNLKLLLDKNKPNAEKKFNTAFFIPAAFTSKLKKVASLTALVKEDVHKAHTHRSAVGGDVKSSLAMATLDPTNQGKWYELAADQGDESAAAIVGLLKKKQPAPPVPEPKKPAILAEKKDPAPQKKQAVAPVLDLHESFIPSLNKRSAELKSAIDLLSANVSDALARFGELKTNVNLSSAHNRLQELTHLIARHGSNKSADANEFISIDLSLDTLEKEIRAKEEGLRIELNNLIYAERKEDTVHTPTTEDASPKALGVTRVDSIEDKKGNVYHRMRGSHENIFYRLNPDETKAAMQEVTGDERTAQDRVESMHNAVIVGNGIHPKNSKKTGVCQVPQRQMGTYPGKFKVRLNRNETQGAHMRKGEELAPFERDHHMDGVISPGKEKPRLH